MIYCINDLLIDVLMSQAISSVFVPLIWNCNGISFLQEIIAYKQWPSKFLIRNLIRQKSSCFRALTQMAVDTLVAPEGENELIQLTGKPIDFIAAQDKQRQESGSSVP